MYWQTLGFKEPPFSLTPNPAFLFMSSHHQEALAHLLFAIDTRAGFIELSGEVGTGKTTIIRTLLGQLSSETHRSAFIFNPTLSPLGLLQEVNRELGLPSTSLQTHELHKTLNEFLLKENCEGRTIVLVIDEAQNLSPEVLEQVRLISNLETEQEKLIQIVLVGQPELKELLGRQELRQLNQRITIRYHLEPMETSDVHSYIRHRIRIASGGGDAVTFDEGASDRISRFSGGLPRLINAVCDRALLLAYTNDTRRVTPQMAKQAVADLLKTGTEKPRRLGVRYAVLILVTLGTIFAGFAYYSIRTVPVPLPQPVLTDTGDINGVRLLQTMLKGTGHFDGTPDGIFDNRTEEAVKRFQQAEGLSEDGKPGGRTLARLYQRSGGKLNPETAVESPPAEGSAPR